LKSVAKIVGILSAIVLIAFVALAVEFLRRQGEFRTLAPHFGGVCKAIAMEASAEDIRIDHGTGFAYLSYLDRRAVLNGDSVNGTIMLVDMNATELHLRAALIAEPPDFRPHGMSLYTPLNGSRKLFVVSHPADGSHRVEIFEQSSSGLFAHAKTITHPLMSSPNAIFAVGPRQFYVVNDRGGKTPFEQFAEVTLRRPLSNVLYFDGQAMRVAITGLKNPTGMAGSHDGRMVYVSDTLGDQLQIFARNGATGVLRSAETIPLDSSPDNITIDEQGVLWIASHPKLLSLLRAFRNASSVAPTQVFKVLPTAQESRRVTEVYLNEGEQLSAGSVAAVHGGRMLIGSAVDPRLLDCSLAD
jgi:arylesterase/paraoxonase